MPLANVHEDFEHGQNYKGEDLLGFLMTGDVALKNVASDLKNSKTKYLKRSPRKLVGMVEHKLSVILMEQWSQYQYLIDGQICFIHPCSSQQPRTMAQTCFLICLNGVFSKNIMPPGNKTMTTPKSWIGWSSGYYFLPLKGARNGPKHDGAPRFAEADGTTKRSGFCSFRKDNRQAVL